MSTAPPLIKRLHPRLELPPPQPFERVTVVSIGPESSGKSALIKRFCEQKFSGKATRTIGVDYGVFPLSPSVRLSLFDLSGKQCYEELIDDFVQDADVFVVVVDLTNAASVTQTKLLIDKIKAAGATLRGVLCGNKSDGPQKTSVSRCMLLAAQSRLHYVTTSAKTGEGVNEAFNKAVEVALNTRQGKDDAPTPLPFNENNVAAVERVLNAKDVYEMLGLAASADKPAIRAAFRSAAATVHPDKNRAPEADDAFKRLNAAVKQLI